MRALPPLVLILMAFTPSAARADIAREPIRRVIRRAFADLRACARRRDLEEGRYVVRFEIDEEGRVRRFRILEAPSPPPRAAARCISAAFQRLRFESPWAPRAASPPARSGGGRRSRLPPDLRTRRWRPGGILVTYPLVLRR